MSNIFPLSRVRSAIPSSKYPLLDIIEGIIKIRLEEAISMAQDIANAVGMRNTNVIGPKPNEVAVLLVQAICCAGQLMITRPVQGPEVREVCNRWTRILFKVKTVP